MTQLYLISPPKIELADFRKQLEAAFSMNSLSLWERGGVRTDSSSDEMPSPLTPLPQGEGNSGAIPEVEGMPLVGAFQLRLKDAEDAEIKAAIRELMPICRDYGVAFIINDRPDLCAEFSCDGVHVGQEDLLQFPSPFGRGIKGEGKYQSDSGPHPSPLPEGALKKIRGIIGEDAVLGVTCHASKHLAMEAGEAGADYVAFGAFFPTTSKPKEKLEKWGTPTPDIISDWVTFAEIPCVAIGGITPENCAPLIRAGADFIAVINAVWSNPDGPAIAVQQFQQVIGQYGSAN